MWRAPSTCGLALVLCMLLAPHSSANRRVLLQTDPTSVQTDTGLTFPWYGLCRNKTADNAFYLDQTPSQSKQADGSTKVCYTIHVNSACPLKLYNPRTKLVDDNPCCYGYSNTAKTVFVPANVYKLELWIHDYCRNSIHYGAGVNGPRVVLANGTAYQLALNWEAQVVSSSYTAHKARFTNPKGPMLTKDNADGAKLCFVMNNNFRTADGKTGQCNLLEKLCNNGQPGCMGDVTLIESDKTIVPAGGHQCCPITVPTTCASYLTTCEKSTYFVGTGYMNRGSLKDISFTMMPSAAGFADALKATCCYPTCSVPGYTCSAGTRRNSFTGMVDLTKYQSQCCEADCASASAGGMTCSATLKYSLQAASTNIVNSPMQADFDTKCCQPTCLTGKDQYKWSCAAMYAYTATKDTTVLLAVTKDSFQSQCCAATCGTAYTGGQTCSSGYTYDTAKASTSLTNPTSRADFTTACCRPTCAAGAAAGFKCAPMTAADTTKTTTLLTTFTQSAYQSTCCYATCATSTADGQSCAAGYKVDTTAASIALANPPTQAEYNTKCCDPTCAAGNLAGWQCAGLGYYDASKASVVLTTFTQTTYQSACCALNTCAKVFPSGCAANALSITGLSDKATPLATITLPQAQNTQLLAVDACCVRACNALFGTNACATTPTVYKTGSLYNVAPPAPPVGFWDVVSNTTQKCCLPTCSTIFPDGCPAGYNSKQTFAAVKFPDWAPVNTWTQGQKLDACCVKINYCADYAGFAGAGCSNMKPAGFPLSDAPKFAATVIDGLSGDQVVQQCCVQHCPNVLGLSADSQCAANKQKPVEDPKPYDSVTVPWGTITMEAYALCCVSQLPQKYPFPYCRCEGQYKYNASRNAAPASGDTYLSASGAALRGPTQLLPFRLSTDSPAVSATATYNEYCFDLLYLGVTPTTAAKPTTAQWCAAQNTLYRVEFLSDKTCVKDKGFKAIFRTNNDQDIPVGVEDQWENQMSGVEVKNTLISPATGLPETRVRAAAKAVRIGDYIDKALGMTGGAGLRSLLTEPAPGAAPTKAGQLCMRMMKSGPCPTLKDLCGGYYADAYKGDASKVRCEWALMESGNQRCCPTQTDMELP